MTQGWLENDEDYQARVTREGNEATVERLTGSEPKKGWFESDESYTQRVRDEANAAIIEISTGSEPSKGWFENESDYRSRINFEAQKAGIKDETGEEPKQGWFESDDDYSNRIRHEAYASTIEGHTGDAPSQGFFEGDDDFRRRVSLEAREARAEESYGRVDATESASYNSSSSSTYSSSSGSSSSFGGGCGLIVTIILVITFLAKSDFLKVATTAPSCAMSVAYCPKPSNTEPPVQAPVDVPSQAGEMTSTETAQIDTAPAVVGLESQPAIAEMTNNPVTLNESNSQSIWSTSVYSYATPGVGPGGGLEDDRLKIGGWGDTYVSLLKFDLPVTRKMKKAILSFHIKDDDASYEPTPINVYRITRSWTWLKGDRLWWRDIPGTSFYARTNTPGRAGSTFEIDITTLYNDWVDNPSENFGILLDPVLNNKNLTTFYSTRAADDLKPKLILTSS